MEEYHARICIYKAIWPPCGEETGGAEKDGGLDGEACRDDKMWRESK